MCQRGPARRRLSTVAAHTAPRRLGEWCSATAHRLAGQPHCAALASARTLVCARRSPGLCARSRPPLGGRDAATSRERRTHRPDSSPWTAEATAPQGGSCACFVPLFPSGFPRRGVAAVPAAGAGFGLGGPILYLVLRRLTKKNVGP